MVRRCAVVAMIVALGACRDDDAATGSGAASDGDEASDAASTAGDGTADDSGGSEGDSEGDVDADDPLAPAEVLTRASLDLRGVRPTVEELDALAADPEALEGMIAAYVDEPAFGARVRDIFAGAWRTRIDEYPLLDGVYAYDPSGPTHDAIGDETLNLLAYVAMNDLPFSEILRSPDTFVDPVLLDGWPLEQLEDGGQWLPPGTVRARYTDGRPTAGVLTLNAVYWRHSSTVENANRGRTNALSQALLCQSYLDRPIDFPTNLDLTDSESIRDAIHTNAACQACHSTLDPLASHLWGFMYPNDEPSPTYSVGSEYDWQIYTDAPPGYFGVPTSRLVDLGEQIAQDERFVSCTVRRMYEGLLGRNAELQDEGALAEHREAFLASNLSLKELTRSIVRDPSYRGERWTPGFGGKPEPVVRKVAAVDVVGRSLGELSGYHLRYGGREATRLDFAVRRLAGGSDRGDSQSVSTGAVLVQRRLAEAGAMYLVDAHAAGETTGGRLDAVLGTFDLGAAASADDVVALVRAARSTTLAVDDPEVLALVQLWADVEAITNPKEAWIALVTAVLADPDHILY
jgi:hypothetical protein